LVLLDRSPVVSIGLAGSPPGRNSRGTANILLRSVSTKEDFVKAIVDETLCSGCGVCEEVAPDVFAMNDAGLVDVKVNPIPEDLQPSAQEAADGCPSGAIVLEA
jgi:ferredoxin